MMFYNQINRFVGAAGRGRQDKKQCQQQVHASYQLFKESLLLKDTITLVSRENSRKKEKLVPGYCISLDLLMASVLFVTVPTEWIA